MKSQMQPSSETVPLWLPMQESIYFMTEFVNIYRLLSKQSRSHDRTINLSVKGHSVQRRKEGSLRTFSIKTGGNAG